ncbi:MAG TPA: hypothetical protein VEL47_07945 [Myxococcota bacterium]|nr:hypothetical protein [Myxococcota bacterium]
MHKFRRLFCAVVLMASQASFSLGNVYLSGTLGLFQRWKETKFIQLEKYEIALGFEFDSLDIFTIASEFRYAHGIRDFGLPHDLEKKGVSPEQYGGFLRQGIHFADARYYELWLRPKLRIPIPFVKPYLAVPVSPLGYGGMKGYGKFSVGLGVVAGADIAISSLRIFVESGFMMRAQKGKDLETPPWGHLDFSVPITLGLGYGF